MNVLIVNTSDLVGGAAVAANRLFKALNKQPGVEARMLVRDKTTDDPNIFQIESPSWKKQLAFVLERAIIFLHNGFNREKLFQVSFANTGLSIVNHPLVEWADIIHLHWINQGLLSLKEIEKINLLNKKIIWTMHDMWPFTGICHHARDCKNYNKECLNCFFLNSNTEDLSTRNFRRKKKIYQSYNITFVACSKWLKNSCKESSLMKGQKVVNIPNPIDLSLFKKIDKNTCRKELKLPLDKKIILFGALDITNERKGVSYLLKSLALLKLKHENIILVVFGQVKKELSEIFPVPVHSMGYLSDLNKIVKLYNAVDTFVTSSLEENLPNMIMESMACGTPCVGFEIGGIPEMIDHKKNGYVAKYKDIEDLAKGIDWVLYLEDSSSLSEECIIKVSENYSEGLVAQKYLDAYISV